MTFVDHLKGSKPELKFLETSFGLHVVAGDLAKSIVTGSSPTHVVTIQQLLGDAYGKGWKGPKGIWYNGINRAAAKYRFYPGIQTPNPVLKTFTADNSTNVFTSTAHGFNDGDMVIFRSGDNPEPIAAGKVYYVRDKTADTFRVSNTSGGAAVDLTDNGTGTLRVYKNDAVQGIDPVFDQDTTHSNVAWIRVECPSGSEVGIPEFDTKANPPDELSGIYECQLGDIYDASGNVTASGQLLTNPADVLAFGLKEIRKYPNSRIDWASLDGLRGISDQLIIPDYTTLLPQGVGLTGRYYEGTSFGTLKQRRVDPVIQYDLSTGAPALDLTATSFSVRWEGKIRFKYTETYTMTLVHNDSGKLWIGNLTTPIIDQAASGTHTATFAATADQWYDIKIEWTNASGDSQFVLAWSSPSQPYQTVPQDRLYPKNESQKRFEAHLAFLGRTNFDDFLRSVLFTCNGAMQDVDGKLQFFCVETLTTPSFAFDASNIVKNSISYYPRFSQQEILSLPNRYIAEGRDLESRYLEPYDPALQFELEDLQEEAGRVIEETVAVGNASRFQALRNLEFYATLRTRPMACELEGMPQTFPVLPGDLVTVTDAISGWTARKFLCIEAVDNSIDADADNRKFKLLDWEDVEFIGSAVFAPTLSSLSWNGITDLVTGNFSVNGGTGTVRVLRKPGRTNEGGTFTEVTTTAASATSFTNSPTPTGWYTYKLTQDGVTGESNVLDVYIDLANVAAISSLSFNSSTNQVTVNITNNGGTGNIQILRRLDGGAWSQRGEVSSGTTSFVDAVSASGTYDYKLTQTGIAGESGIQSITVTVTASAPSDLVVSEYCFGFDLNVDLGWINNGASGNVIVQRKRGSGFWSSIATLSSSTDSYTDIFFDGSQTGFYFYRVYNTAVSGYSNEVSVFNDGSCYS